VGAHWKTVDRSICFSLPAHDQLNPIGIVKPFDDVSHCQFRESSFQVPSAKDPIVSSGAVVDSIPLFAKNNIG